MDRNKLESNCCFSKELIEEHYRLYPGAHEKKLKEIEARLLKADTTMANPTYCPLRSLKKEHTYALNSVKLHGYFFENVTEKQISQPSPEMVSMLERCFGSVLEWEKQFSALAMCSRGWVVLGFDLSEGILRNYFADNHSEGVWSVLPILVLDVYEHAYCTVFPTRSEYVQKFLRCVKWETVNMRLNTANEVYEKIIKMSKGGSA